jgi:hypothetical protein
VRRILQRTFSPAPLCADAHARFDQLPGVDARIATG